MSISSSALKVVSIELRSNSTLTAQVPTPRNIEGHNKDHTQRASLWNTAISGPSFSQPSSKLEAKPDICMIGKLNFPEPFRKTQPSGGWVGGGWCGGVVGTARSGQKRGLQKLLPNMGVTRHGQKEVAKVNANSVIRQTDRRIGSNCS